LDTSFRALLHTASSVKLSESHAAAACDALRGCLTHCESSDSSDLKDFAYSIRTWTDLFDIYLKVSESKKSKPLKQLLVALERNLARNASQSVQYDLVAYITSKTWRIISMKDDVNAVKPALQALRHFLAKSVVRAPDIISTILEEESPDHNEGSPFRGLGSLPYSSLYAEHSRTFICTVLHWLGHPDTAPITGRLISSFCRSFRLCSSSLITPPNAMGDKSPIWLSALKSLSKKQSNLFDLFDIHVLPEIMRQDHEGQEDFISTLPLHHLRSDDITEYSSEDLRIYLMVLRSSKGSGVEDIIGTPPSVNLPNANFRSDGILANIIVTIHALS
ncbi:MAG: hypothetical protein LQ352_007954, partial [Teloschistes flavicans]